MSCLIHMGFMSHEFWIELECQNQYYETLVNK